MEQGPAKRMSYEGALVLAKASPVGWEKIQIRTLENHLAEVAADRREGELFYQYLREASLGGYSVEKLVALGNRFEMLENYNLEKESLELFCRDNNMELVP